MYLFTWLEYIWSQNEKHLWEALVILKAQPWSEKYGREKIQDIASDLNFKQNGSCKNFSVTNFIQWKKLAFTV